MRRLQLFEFEDQAWLPALLRDCGTDFLRFVSMRGDQTAGLLPRLRLLLERSGGRRIVDLCSGGGGPVERVAQQLAASGAPTRVTLSDFFPNHAAFERMSRASDGAIDFEPEPVDARRVPAHLAGMRTLFNAFHHFRPDDARAILADARRARSPIAIVELVSRHPLSLLGMPLSALLVVPLVTPFIRPFRLGRLLFTYLIPLLPLLVLWDGLVSCLRVYSPPELDELCVGLAGDDWVWESGRVANGLTGAPVTYLLGYPRDVPADPDSR